MRHWTGSVHEAARGKLRLAQSRGEGTSVGFEEPPGSSKNNHNFNISLGPAVLPSHARRSKERITGVSVLSDPFLTIAAVRR